jgi:UDP-glucose 4-epimerase
MNSNLRVVVIGASGNVGTSLLARLQDDPRITSIVAVARRVPDVSAAEVRWVRADVGIDDLDPIVAGADVVVSLAWRIQPQHDEAAMAETNVVGTMRTFGAAARAGVPAFVYASSVGTYAKGPKDRRVDESWPSTGIASSVYSRHKAMVERLLDDAERTHPQMRIVRMRTSLVFQRQAASEIARFFLGPLVPRSVLGPRTIPIVPRAPRLVLQAVHADDAAAAYHEAVVRDVRGAFNIAGEPVLDPDALAQALDARPVPVSPALLRAVLWATWRLRLQPTAEGWLDMGLQTPMMDTTRARRELGWSPSVTATDALVELLTGIRDRAAGDTPALAPGRVGPMPVPTPRASDQRRTASVTAMSSRKDR